MCEDMDRQEGGNSSSSSSSSSSSIGSDVNTGMGNRACMFYLHPKGDLLVT